MKDHTLPNAPPPIMVTGGSGFLGSHFLLSARELGRTRAFVLVRGPDATARDRKLAAALDAAARSYGAAAPGLTPQITVLGGDIEQPLCGLSPADHAALGRTAIAEFWHFAASLRFEERYRSRIYAQNLAGTRNAVLLAAASGARRFIHVSTAYTAGVAEGVIREELHECGRPFANCYEASKCRAEHLVMRLCGRFGLQATILRPSIVVGPAVTKLPGGSRSGLYSFIAQFAALRGLLRRRGGEPIRIPGIPSAEINLIPVDHVMRDIRHIVERGFYPKLVFHLCSSQSPSAQSALSIICDALGICGIELVPDCGPVSPVPARLLKRLRFFHAYASLDRRFERSLPGRWTVSAQDFRAFAAKAVEELTRQPQLGATGSRELALHRPSP